LLPSSPSGPFGPSLACLLSSLVQLALPVLLWDTPPLCTLSFLLLLVLLLLLLLLLVLLLK
ncbi:hypothetical protein, partial [Clostridioides difficile]|uniref:hypothetical protein n=1 Tax=Clostridioides difficile TaxID=1496 RepID=UPI001A9A4AF8